jgi:hypothetical protein
MGSRRLRFTIAWAVGHLIAVATAAAHLSLDSSKPPGNLVRAYGDLTGAANNYGFFAPAVASQIRARFLIAPAEGPSSVDTLEVRRPETDLRLNTMLSFFGVSEAQDLLARSWAATMFGKHPEAVTVTVVADTFILPTMREYREGKRPQWVEFYRGVFARAARDRRPPISSLP